ncbi:MAG: response regulator [Acidobacteriota bacterium]
MKVLVVDDDRLIRKMARAVLEEEGHECLEAGTPAEALHLLREARPEVCFLDLILPDMDGLTLLRLYSAEAGERRVRVFLLTGSESDDLLEQARSCGAEGILRKPFDPELLIAKLK